MKSKTKQIAAYLRKKRLRQQKIIAVDFDGTLSLGKYPLCGPENLELTNFLRSILQQPFNVRPLFFLWTSREGQPLKDAIDWLAEIGIVFDSVNQSPKKRSFGDSRKITADLYIDDRAITPTDFINMANNGLYEVLS